MSPPETKVDVLVVGGGPAGLMCANALAKFGVNVKVIDKRPIKVAAGQADGIQPRTIEVFQSYGLADDLLRQGNQMHFAAFYNPGPNGGIERTERAPDVTAPTARYPFEVTLHQGAIENIFLESMKQSGIEIQRPYVPVSLDISEDPRELADPGSYPVKVIVECLDKANVTECIRAKYVVGCDGAHSWVRKNLQIAMEGEQSDFIWGVVDTVPETNFPDIRNRCVIHSNNGSLMVIPREGDKVRLYIQLNEADVITNGRVDKEKIDAYKLLSVAKKTFQPYKVDFPKELEWWTIYIIGQRVASAYNRKERVFIAGDACHTHSPQAGQGMNASMNDTHNLAWKLTQVLRGWASPSLLSTYEFERRKYAQDLINFDRKFATLFSGKPRTGGSEEGVSHEEFLEIFQTFGGFTSGIGVHYEPSIIANAKYQELAPGLPIGQRLIPQVLVRAADGRPFQIQDLLPSDARFRILVFAGDINDNKQLEKVNCLAVKLEMILSKYARNEKIERIFEILTISAASKQNVEYVRLPRIMRPHWSNVFVDQKEVQGIFGGTVYSTYGISPVGAIIVVRPDGYIGAVAPLDGDQHVDGYFAGFMKR